MNERYDVNKSSSTGFIPATENVSPNKNGAHAANNVVRKKDAKHNRRIAIVVIVIIAVLLICYFVGFFIFSGRFYPNTTINDLDISMNTSEEAANALEDSLAKYELRVEGQGLDFTLNAEQAGLTLDAETIASNMMSEVNPWLWPVEVFQNHDETDALEVTYKESAALTSAVEDKVNTFNETAVQPQDASVNYDESSESFGIVKDSVGTALDAGKVVDVVSAKAIELAPTAELDASVLKQPRIVAQNESLIQACDNANAMIHTSLQLEMADTVMGEVNPTLVASWITFEEPGATPEEEGEQTAELDESAEEDTSVQDESAEEDAVYQDDEEEYTEEDAVYQDDEYQDDDEEYSDEDANEWDDDEDETSSDESDESTEQASAHLSDALGVKEAYADEADLEVNDELIEEAPTISVVLNEDAVYNWALEVTKNCDTVGTTRSYTRADGKEITVSGGSYGWYTSTNGLKGLVVDALYAHDGGTLEIPTTQTGEVFNGVGTRDWGARYIDIDLSEQYVYFYDSSGSCIWSSACVSGLPDGKRNTPTGVYYIYSKERNAVLRDEARTYETPVSYWMPFNGGIGLHDANWQSNFGGSQYKVTGSHGCVNLPPSAAANLYEIVSIGDPVVCHW